MTFLNNNNNNNDVFNCRYFRQGDYYGAACYGKMEIGSESERGVRMKSVGVIVAHYAQLRPHLQSLAKLVRCVCMYVCMCVCFSLYL